MTTGCAAWNVPPVGPVCNPSFLSSERHYQKDRWAKDADPRIQFCLDEHGHPYPDPATGVVDPERLKAHDFCVERTFRGHYDSARITREYADRINEACRDGRTLIVLIHGFNHTYPEASRAYKGTRLVIRDRYRGRPFAFLEVHWDGFYGDSFAIWPRAQVSSKWAGLGLRLLLAELDSRIPVRVLTHSRGAAVICSALWNTPMRGTVEEDGRYREAQDALRPPALRDLRLGLLAPALRPGDLECYFDRGGIDVPPGNRIFLGINPDDEALNAGGFSWLAGTSLGCNLELFESIVAPVLNRGVARAFAVDFSGSAFHAFTDYVLRDVFEEQFLPMLLDEGPAAVVAGGR